LKKALSGAFSFAPSSQIFPAYQSQILGMHHGLKLV
jgi:hypothetical protein